MTTGRPRYGSRKIFFQRLWARLHGPSEDGESAVVVQADVTPQKAKEEAQQLAMGTSSITTVTTSTSPSRPRAASSVSSIASENDNKTTATSASTSTTPLVVVPPTTTPATSGNKRSRHPTEVSNYNTDEDVAGGGTAEASNEPGENVVLNIRLTLNNNNSNNDDGENPSTKKIKLDAPTKEGNKDVDKEKPPMFPAVEV